MRTLGNATMNEKLKPCPFCSYPVGHECLLSGMNEWWVKCAACESTGSARGSEKTAVSYWNMRAKPKAIAALNTCDRIGEQK